MNSAAYEKKIAANVHHWIAMAFTQERHEACHSTVHRGICNSHFDNGVCNGASLILKLDKILLILREIQLPIENIEVPQPRELKGSFSIRSVQEEAKRMGNLQT